MKPTIKFLAGYYLLSLFRSKMFQTIGSRHVLTFLKETIRLFFHKDMPLKEFDNIRAYFYGKNGLEIGGPSTLFSHKSILPIYIMAKNLDNCNYSSETIWEGKINEGLTFSYHGNMLGYQFVREATDLEGIKSESYDFVISAHVLEHVANPLTALFEWKRVVKNGGVLLLIVPHKQGTFDHKRPITKLDHLIRDYENEIDEDDMSHLSEILRMHDLLMDPQAKTYDDFVTRAKDNFKNRCLHHHVFVTEEAVRMIDYVGLKILFVRSCLPWHIIICGQKVVYRTEHERVKNHNYNIRFLDKNDPWRKSSPFTLDKIMIQNSCMLLKKPKISV